MRTAILDVGSNSAHLKIVDLVAGEPIRTVLSVKRPTRLAEAIQPDGRISRTAVERLVSAVSEAHRAARAEGSAELIAFATSAVRDAVNRSDIVDQVTGRTGVDLCFLSGRDEARLTFLAARAWYGWSAGPLLMADIGGGSLEIATGTGAEAATALSLPLGAGRLTRDHLPGDPPARKHVRRLRRFLTTQLAEHLSPGDHGQPKAYPIATSKTFTQLAKLTGDRNPNGYRVLRLKELDRQITRLAKRTAEERAELRGISRSRSRQILAGALIAESVMTVLALTRIEICPWALREGIALRRLQQLHAGTAHHIDDIGHLLQPLRDVPTPIRALSPVSA
ncbi:Ppx/GppA phosphatase family protein [Spirillospora sp. NPDC048911]|uniref:Ppx/GppA phosphatase family protein n=1 Tax=Spirillospora sp. NPDC048911 TaxID=3364527 RepID=UPI00371A0B46